MRENSRNRAKEKAARAPLVKAREKAGELVWLDEHSQRPDVTTTRGGDGESTGDAYDEELDGGDGCDVEKTARRCVERPLKGSAEP